MLIRQLAGEDGPTNVANKWFCNPVGGMVSVLLVSVGLSGQLSNPNQTSTVTGTPAVLLMLTRSSPGTLGCVSTILGDGSTVVVIALHGIGQGFVVAERVRLCGLLQLGVVDLLGTTKASIS